MVAPITQHINLSINTCTFPDKLKIAHVVPIHKKNSSLLKGNNRPVSILPTISTIFERAIDEQLVNNFDLHFNIYLSAFRSSYSCQDTLIRIIEDWKNLLDNNQCRCHRGSQLYFHITRYVLKRKREDTFWGAKSESRVSAPFFASKTV